MTGNCPLLTKNFLFLLSLFLLMKNKHKKGIKISPLLVPWIVFGVLMTLTAVTALPTKIMSYEVSVPYIDKENYTIEVPFETVEPYTVQIPYETKEQYVESVPYTEEESYVATENYCDNNPGCSCTSTHWFWGYCVSCDCRRTVTEYKEVIKDRTVTKYREETQYRTITKTRAETREREVRKEKNETIQKEVNWIFGFDAPIKFRNLG